MMETGTLRELDVKVGDAVELVSTDVLKGHTYTIQEDARVLDNDGSGHYYGFISDDISFPRKWRIISRAPDTTKTWGEMTDADKGAMLLYEYEHGNKSIQYSIPDDGYDFSWGEKTVHEAYRDDWSYRIKPEPKRETVTIGSSDVSWGHLIDALRDHRITFDTIDGEPDVCSIKMEEI